MCQDFLETVMPYLLKDGDLDANEASKKLLAKQAELKDYREVFHFFFRELSLCSRALL